MEQQKVLISHSTKDAETASCLASFIGKCSLRQIQPWFSSDSSGNGGLLPGDRWVDRIRSELGASRAVIVLLTPHSIDSPWVHFEAGYGAANGDLEIIPVIAGLKDFSSIPNPLTHWQMFRVDEVSECTKFLKKLLQRLEVHFDEELLSDAIRGFVRDIERQFEEFENDSTDNDADLSTVGQLRYYLDQKFFDLAERISKDETNFSGYDILVKNDISDKPIIVRVDLQTSFQRVLNDLYYKLEDKVEVYSYLRDWIMRDLDTGQNFVLREVAKDIPARALLWPGRKVVVELLEKPYNGADGSPIAHLQNIPQRPHDYVWDDESPNSF